MDPKTVSPWLRVVAVLSAVGLAGAYVWNRQQHAASPVGKSAERTVLSGSKSAVVVPNSENLKFETEYTPDSDTGNPVEEKEMKDGNRILLSGSKSGMIEIAPEPPKKRVLLPSSKSSGSLIEAPTGNQPSNKP